MTLKLCLLLLSWTYISSCVPGCPSSKALKAERSPQFLVSPNYPGKYGVYGQRLSCSWLITAGSQYDDVVIQIKVLNSSMEYSTGCVRDSVQIFDGPKDFFRSLASFCGFTRPKTTITSSRPTVLVKFGIDFKNNDYYGFRLAYWVAKKPIFLVNEREWTGVNYALLVISIVLLVGGPGWLAGLYIKREVLPKLKNRRKTE